MSAWDEGWRRNLRTAGIVLALSLGLAGMTSSWVAGVVFALGTLVLVVWWRLEESEDYPDDPWWGR